MVVTGCTCADRVVSVPGRAIYKAASSLLESSAGSWSGIPNDSCYALDAGTRGLIQDKSDARQMFKFVDSRLGVPLPEKNYAANCELTLPNILVLPQLIEGSIGCFCIGSHFWLGCEDSYFSRLLAVLGSIHSL